MHCGSGVGLKLKGVSLCLIYGYRNVAVVNRCGQAIHILCIITALCYPVFVLCGLKYGIDPVIDLFAILIIL